MNGTRWSLVRDDRGAVAIIVAVLMLALIGFTALVVDVGSMYQVRREMVNAADAAALAGAQELAFDPSDTDAAIGLGTQYAIENGSDPALTSVEIEGSRVIASTGKRVEYVFARVFGLTDGDVPARAVAIVGPVGAMKGLRPIAFAEEAYHAALNDPETVLLRKHEVGPGNWGLLDFNRNGAKLDEDGKVVNFKHRDTLLKYLESGWPHGVAINDPHVATNPGMNFFPPPPRVGDVWYGLEGQEIYVPIVRGDPTGTKPIEVIGFAKVYVEEFVAPNGSEPGLLIRFIETALVGPDGFVDPDAADFGLRTWDLIE